ncbi:MAG: hypothetical protein ACK4MS_10680 [Paracoccaceae bacterium]
MTTPIWPETLPQTPRRGTWTGGPVDERVSFKADRGPPIERAGVTAAHQTWGGTFPNLKPFQVEEWDRFVANDLRGGMVPFLWRDPITGQMALWKLMPRGGATYELSARGATLTDLTVQLMRLPDIWMGPS